MPLAKLFADGFPEALFSLTARRLAFSIPGGQLLFESIGIRTAAAVFRPIAELHHVFLVMNAARLHKAAVAFWEIAP